MSATVSPMAVYAGVRRSQGGNAADAAATTALTQITTQLGSVVSYAGIFTMVYYDAKTHKVYSLDAGYNSYLSETDPRTIPVATLARSTGRSADRRRGQGPRDPRPRIHGRRGGHARALWPPAIQRSVRAGHLVRRARRAYLAYPPGFFHDPRQVPRPHAGRTAFMRQAGGEHPRQEPLRPARARRDPEGGRRAGSRLMYTGQWGQDFVRIVQREGGKVTAEDLARYRADLERAAQEHRLRPHGLRQRSAALRRVRPDRGPQPRRGPEARSGARTGGS